MLDFIFFNPESPVTEDQKTEIIDFLHTHLDRYGDTREAIGKAIIYAMRGYPHPGGFVLMLRADQKIAGAVVVNRTGMEGYIPENILVYIAVDKKFRGRGYGREIMNRTLELAEGDVKLHVEYDNPARFLYQKLGFTSKYMEMRLVKKSK
jgi:[ribosomal protein S18]-alanine N-acetyltransferase